MQLAQWGMDEQLAADPALWLCHQCNDCTERCPRDARPGDVMQVLRGLAVETLATPRFMGELVGDVRRSWPLLLGAPILFWVALLAAYNGLTIPEPPLVYDRFVPHVLIYAVYFTVTGLVAASFWVSGWRFWRLLGQGATRSGNFYRHLWGAVREISLHRRFSSCGPGQPRRWGHFALLWGFVAAAVASAVIVVVMYGFGQPLPLPQTHVGKLIGNLGAVLLIFGAFALLLNRLENPQGAGATRAFDAFFLFLVLLVTVTGVLTEAGRYVFEPALACYIYIVHLGSVLCLFATAPYSKFAHMMYRTLAMVHESMVAAAAQADGASEDFADEDESLDEAAERA